MTRRWSSKSLSIGRMRSAGWLLVCTSLCMIGCTQVTHQYLKYEPISGPPKLADAKSPPVSVEVTDKRTSTTLLTRTSGYFGEFTVEYVPYNDVPEMIKEAFETELRDRGFVRGASGNVVSVSISFYRADQMPTSFFGETDASLGIEVTVKHPDGSTAYSRFVLGDSRPWEAEHPPEHNIKYQITNAVEAAMQDALAKVFNDPGFINALKTS